jgi:putative glutamine amidotransferase
MTRPRICITTSYNEGRQALDVYYVRAIEAAGGLPMIVPVFETDEAAREFTALLDGLVITGGPGITKGLIGELPSDLEAVDPVRDENDTRVYEAMPDKPVLGICYGMQFINAQAGGTIYADVYAQKPGVLLHSAGRGASDHTVQIETDSHIQKVLGASELMTNTYHIQAVNEIGAGLQAVGFGPDGVVEAIESQDGRLIGVQFHPERMFDHTRPLFEDFVNRCRIAR